MLGIVDDNLYRSFGSNIYLYRCYCLCDCKRILIGCIIDCIRPDCLHHYKVKIPPIASAKLVPAVTGANARPPKVHKAPSIDAPPPETFAMLVPFVC